MRCLHSLDLPMWGSFWRRKLFTLVWPHVTIKAPTEPLYKCLRSAPKSCWDFALLSRESRNCHFSCSEASSVRSVWMFHCWHLFFQILQFSEITVSSFGTSIFKDFFFLSECSLFSKVAANSTLHRRDAAVSNESTDFKLKAVAGNADPWSRRWRPTILGLKSRAYRSKNGHNSSC